MINITNLSIEEQIYMVELANKIVNPPIDLETLNSLKPGVLNFALNNINLPNDKKDFLNSIVNKVLLPVIVEGEYYIIPEQLELKF